MSEESEFVGDTTRISGWLERHRKGDESAKAEIIAHSCERLRVLTSKILRGSYERLGRWEQTGDVLQNVLLRLNHTLSKKQPETVQQFMGLAANRIRWELRDLIRHHFGPEGEAKRHHSDNVQTDGHFDLDKRRVKSLEPETPEEWDALLEAVEKLPEEERAVIDLIYFQEMPQSQAAELLEVTDRTIRRRLLSAKASLKEAMGIRDE